MRTQEGACPSGLQGYLGVWVGVLSVTNTVWLVICLSSVLKQGFPTPFSSLPMGQHNFVFLIYIVTVLDRPKTRNSGGVWAADQSALPST